MATPDQIAGFEATWAPFAVQAGQQLGVNPATILAQWGMESGYGTNSLSGFNNVGSIKDPSTGSWAHYASPADFAQAFTGLIQRTYPNAVGAADNVDAYTQALAHGGTGGNLSYFGTQDPASYESALLGAGRAFAAADPAGWQQVFAQGGGQTYTPSYGQRWLDTAKGMLGGAAGAVGGAVAGPAANIGMLAFGLLLVGAVVVVGVTGSRVPLPFTKG